MNDWNTHTREDLKAFKNIELKCTTLQFVDGSEGKEGSEGKDQELPVLCLETVALLAGGHTKTKLYG